MKYLILFLFLCGCRHELADFSAEKAEDFCKNHGGLRIFQPDYNVTCKDNAVIYDHSGI